MPTSPQKIYKLAGAPASALMGKSIARLHNGIMTDLVDFIPREDLRAGGAEICKIFCRPVSFY
jgi:hypothetical protein